MTSSERWAHLLTGHTVTEHTVSGVGGTPLHVIEAGSGPPVLLVHGFPELGYSWRRQLPALVQAGYRVIVPDQRGYGGSGCPEDVSAYDIEHLVGDLVAILDHLDEPSAHFVGHDWGASVVWQSSLLIPERVNSVAALSVPFTPRPNHRPTDIWRRRFGDEFFYILYFQEPGVADADLDRDPARTMRHVLTGTSSDSTLGPDGSETTGFVDRYIAPDTLPDWLSESELAVYVDAFSTTGFRGPINWYRNFDRNWERTPHLAGARVSVPSVFIGGSADPVLGITKLDAHLALLEDHRGNVMIDGGGHWIQQERPEEVNAALLDFLGSVKIAGLNLQRKAAITQGGAADHFGRVTVSRMANFDMNRTIFGGLEGIARKFMDEKLAKDVAWNDDAKAKIESAYAATEIANPVPAIDQQLIDFMVQECDFNMEHADGTFLEHLVFCHDYAAHHYPQHSPNVALLHSILGTATNTFAMEAAKIPELNEHLTDFESLHVEAFPSILRLLYNDDLLDELERNVDRLDELSTLHCHRVIDNEPLSMDAESLWINLNYHLMHFVDFMPGANWSTHSADPLRQMFERLSTFLDSAGQRQAHVDITFPTTKKAPVGEDRTLFGRVSGLLPSSVTLKLARKSIQDYSDLAGHNLGYRLEWTA